MLEICWEKWSTLFTNKEIQAKAILRFHFILVTMAIILKYNNKKC